MTTIPVYVVLREDINYDDVRVSVVGVYFTDPGAQNSRACVEAITPTPTGPGKYTDIYVKESWLHCDGRFVL